MSKQTQKTSLAVAVGAALSVSLAGAGQAVSADDNPFGMKSLGGGYMVASAEGKCGEGKCGGAKSDEEKEDCKKGAEGKCGGDKKDHDEDHDDKNDDDKD